MSTSAVDWSGGFEPFGADYSGASEVGVFLRFPGQWADGSWVASGEGVGVSYNVWRWYSVRHATYGRKDPLLSGSEHYTESLRLADLFRHSVLPFYFYANGNPISFSDPLGLFIVDPSCYKNGFSPSEISRAARHALVRLKGGCFLSEPLRSKTIKALRSARIKCSNRWVCGMTRRIQPFGNEIHIGKRHIMDPEKCPGGIGATLVHEAVHRTEWNVFGNEKRAEVCTSLCYGFPLKKDQCPEDCQ